MSYGVHTTGKGHGLLVAFYFSIAEKTELRYPPFWGEMDHFGGFWACFPGGKLHFSAAPCVFLTIRIKEEFWGNFLEVGKNFFPGDGAAP